MARAGRKRKAGARRHPNGSVVRERTKPTDETVQRRAVQMAEVILAYPTATGGPIAALMQSYPDTSWYIGRLFLAGVISQSERDAADQYRKVIEEYRTLLGGPKTPTGLDARRIGGLEPVSPIVATQRFKAVKKKYDRYHDALAVHGNGVVKAVTKALNEETPNHEFLFRGLKALAAV